VSGWKRSAQRPGAEEANRHVPAAGELGWSATLTMSLAADMARGRFRVATSCAVTHF
jgi:hypothetical protein